MGTHNNQDVRVLYIDDEEILRDIVSEYLHAVGHYDVRTAENGKVGVEMAESWKPHFILVDVRMPVMDGPEAIRVLRGKPETSQTPIYVLSAYSDRETMAICEKAGADGFFTKPPNYHMINQTIRRVLEKKGHEHPNQSDN